MAIVGDWGGVPDVGERPGAPQTLYAARGRVETCCLIVTVVGTTAAEDGEGAVGCAGGGCCAADPSSVRTRSINLYRGGESLTRKLGLHTNAVSNRSIQQ